jgi:AmiR/NasT family two-component response regulator
MGPIHPYDEIVRLRRALQCRDVIGQAKGILMERHGLTSEQAFGRLVEMSQQADLDLQDVATYLVALRVDASMPRSGVDEAIID